MEDKKNLDKVPSIKAWTYSVLPKDFHINSFPWHKPAQRSIRWCGVRSVQHVYKRTERWVIRPLLFNHTTFSVRANMQGETKRGDAKIVTGCPITISLGPKLRCSFGVHLILIGLEVSHLSLSNLFERNSFVILFLRTSFVFPLNQQTTYDLAVEMLTNLESCANVL